ncbi:MAG: hypothetical protein H8D82_00380 [Euryarchaeota archaeon]|nr:hypothetical protein [Euryarchaeota archaeon]
MLPEQYLLSQFWLPLALIPLLVGLAISADSKRRLIGKIFIVILLLIIIAHPSPLEDSLEGWTLHLTASMIGPVAALLFGIWFSLFSGPIPVSPLPRGVRPFGFALIILSVAWFAWMLFEARPAISGVQNPWWQHFVMSLLTTLVIVAGFAAAFALIMGDNRVKETLVMAAISLTSFGMLIYLLAQGTTSDDPVYWRSASWGVLGDLGGMLFGGGLAMITFVTFVWLGEKRMGAPEPVEPLSTDEEKVVSEILSAHLEGEA